MRGVNRLVIVPFLVFSIGVFAQNKIAHIDVQELLTQMPEMKSVQGELEKLQKTYTSDIESSLKELQSRATTYRNEANVLSQEELESRAEEFRKKGEELQTMEANIQQARQVAAQELQSKQAELLQPLLKKVEDAIKKVSGEKNYNYVLDSSKGGSVIVANGDDIAAEVRKKLGF